MTPGALQLTLSSNIGVAHRIDLRDEMSLLVCPLCGKSSSMRYYDPSDFKLDIYAKDVVGLGRGKGFATTSKYSLLGNPEALAPMRDRLLDLVGLLRDNDIINEEEFQELFGASSPEVMDNTADTGTPGEDTNGINPRIAGLVTRVSDALNTDLSDEGETPIDRLESGVEKLIDDYQAFVASEEEGE